MTKENIETLENIAKNLERTARLKEPTVRLFEIAREVRTLKDATYRAKLENTARQIENAARLQNPKAQLFKLADNLFKIVEREKEQRFGEVYI